MIVLSSQIGNTCINGMLMYLIDGREAGWRARFYGLPKIFQKAQQVK
jgi:hypothetical protein